jgi:hypothetical protein
VDDVLPLLARRRRWNPTKLPGYVNSPYSVAQLRAAGKLWQDTGATVPAAANNDPVKLMQCGALNYTAASDSARPLLFDEGGGKWSLTFDGVDDTLEATVSWVGAYTIGMSVRLTTASNFNMFCVLNTNEVELRCSSTTGRPQLSMNAVGTGATLATSIAATPTVLIGRHNATGGTGSLSSSAASESGTATVVNADSVTRVRIGSRVGGSLFAAMRWRGLAVSQQSISDPNAALLQAYLLGL